MKDICYWWDPIRERFFGGTIAWRDDALIDWLTDSLIHWSIDWLIDQMSAADTCFRPQPSWPIFSLFLPVQFSLFTLLYEQNSLRSLSSFCCMSWIFYFTQCPKRQGGVNNSRMILIYRTGKHYTGNQIDVEQKNRCFYFFSAARLSNV